MYGKKQNAAALDFYSQYFCCSQQLFYQLFLQYLWEIISKRSQKDGFGQYSNLRNNIVHFLAYRRGAYLRDIG